MIHEIIAVLIFPFSPFTSFWYFVNYVDGDKISKADLASDLKRELPESSRLYKIFRL